MTTADWALVISLCSFAVALAGFVWSIWSKFIYPRANIRPYIAACLIVGGDGSPARKAICLSATNYGPTDITLRTHTAKRRQGFCGSGGIGTSHWLTLSIIPIPTDRPDTWHKAFRRS